MPLTQHREQQPGCSPEHWGFLVGMAEGRGGLWVALGAAVALGAVWH